MMSYSYSHLYRLPMTGLRFFTVYGPWGRPDMAAYLFTAAIIEGRPIKLFNHGDMKRDFTYIDDIVDGVIAALDSPPADNGGGAPHRLYNIGNNRSEPLLQLRFRERSWSSSFDTQHRREVIRVRAREPRLQTVQRVRGPDE